MRSFEDNSGEVWIASVEEEVGPDYKGRFIFKLTPEGGDEAKGISLGDVRWNTRRTAERTLEVMSVVELRRRLRSARGRAGVSTRDLSRSGRAP